MTQEYDNEGRTIEKPPSGAGSVPDLLFEPAAQGSGGGAADLAREVINFPTDAAEFLGRTQVTEREIKNHLRIRAHKMSVTTGTVDMDQLQWNDYNLRVSLGRKGREEMVQVITGLRDMMMAPMVAGGCGFSNFMERGNSGGRDMQKNGVAAT